MVDSVLSVREILVNDVLQAERELERKKALVAELDAFSGGPDESPDWLSFRQSATDRQAIGERFATGLPTLDLRLDGGLYAGTVTIVQGKPAIGKTNLGTQIALHMGRTCAVGALFADEGLAGAVVTIGQQLGYARAAMLKSDADAVNAAVVALDETQKFFRMVKPSSKTAAVESFFSDFDRIAPAGMQRVLLLDSAQVVRMLPKQGVRETRFDLLYRIWETLRDLTVEGKFITLVMSKANRASFRTVAEEEALDPLAAGYGGNGEFAAELLMHLAGKPTKEQPTVTLKIAKNRISAAGIFDLKLVQDIARKRFNEVDVREEEAQLGVKMDRDVAITRDAVIAVLRKTPEGLSSNQVVQVVPGRRVMVLASLKALEAENKVFFESGKNRTMIWKMFR